jgi:hypothetical protein
MVDVIALAAVATDDIAEKAAPKRRLFNLLSK